MLNNIPDSATFEDIQYHIYVREKVENSLQQLNEGKTSTQTEIEARMQQWLGK